MATAVAAGLVVIVFVAVILYTPDPSTGANNEWLRPNEQNAAIFRSYINECWKEGRIEKLGELLTSDYVQHTPGLPPIEGRDEIAQSIQEFRELFPDARFNIEAVNANKDGIEAWVKISVRYDNNLVLPDGTVLTSTSRFLTYGVWYSVRLVDNGTHTQITEIWVQPEGAGLWLQMELLSSDVTETAAQQQHTETVFQLDRLLDQTARSEADFVGLVDPALALHVTARDGTITEGTYADLVSGGWNDEALSNDAVSVERILVQGDLVGVQVLVHEDSPEFEWAEQITLYRFDGERVAELWRFWLRKFK
jgi:predicted SnoaL-like aldol condensation-catalyzing enzyme